jgi:hypothetical protein
VPERWQNDLRKAIAVLAYHVHACFQTCCPRARDSTAAGHGSFRGIGPVEPVEQQDLAQMENAGAALRKVEVVGVKQCIRATLMKERPTPRSLHRHHIGVRRGRYLGRMKLPRIDAMRMTIGANRITR